MRENTRDSISVRFLRRDPLNHSSNEWAKNSSICSNCTKPVSSFAPILEGISTGLIPNAHHCRNCGLTFCDACCQLRLKFRTGGIGRVCNACSSLVDTETAAQSIQKWFKHAKKKKQLECLLHKSTIALQKREQTCDKLGQENEKLNDELKVAQTEIRSLWDAQASTQAQLGHLAEALELAEKEPNSLKTAVNARITTLESTIMQLREEVTDAARANIELVERSNSLSECNESLVKLNNELAHRTTKLADRVEAIMSSNVVLHERNKALVVQSEEFKVEISSLNDANEELGDRNVQLAKTNASLDKRVHVLDDQISNLEEEVIGKDEQLQTKEKELSKKERELGMKESELKRTKSELGRKDDELKEALNEKDTTSRQLVFSEAAEQSLRQRVKFMETAIAEVADAVENSKIDDPKLLERLSILRNSQFDLTGQFSTSLSPQWDGAKRPQIIRGLSLDPTKVVVRGKMRQAHEEVTENVLQNLKQYPSKILNEDTASHMVKGLSGTLPTTLPTTLPGCDELDLDKATAKASQISFDDDGSDSEL